MLKKINPRLRVGLLVVSVFILLGLVLPWFAPADPRTWNVVPRNLLASPQHLLGTTGLGQDTLWFLSWAVRNSLIIGVIVAFFSTAIGVIVGLVAGFQGAIIDRVLTLGMDAIIVIPSLPILILLASLLKGRASLLLIVVVLIVFNWPWPARQARAFALTMRERDFISMARFSGESTFKIIRLEIFPYLIGWALSNLINTVLVAIATESALAVIGLSSLSDATLGTMIYWALNHQALLAERWLWIGSPVVSIMALFIGLFLTSTGFQDYYAVRRGR